MKKQNNALKALAVAMTLAVCMVWGGCSNSIESCRAKKIVLPLAMSALFLSCGINSTDKKNSEFFPPVQSKDEHILALEAKNRALEESKKKILQLFYLAFWLDCRGNRNSCGAKLAAKQA